MGVNILQCSICMHQWPWKECVQFKIHTKHTYVCFPPGWWQRGGGSVRLGRSNLHHRPQQDSSAVPVWRECQRLLCRWGTSYFSFLVPNNFIYQIGFSPTCSSFALWIRVSRPFQHHWSFFCWQYRFICMFTNQVSLGSDVSLCLSCQYTNDLQ